MSTFDTGAAIDRQIANARAATPSSYLERRKVPRASISEINDLDLDTIQKRMAASSGPDDDRGPVQKVMDLIDLPRNTNANIAFGHPTLGGILSGIGVRTAEGAAIGGAGGALAGGIGALPGAIAGGLTGAAVGLGTGAVAAVGRLFGGGAIPAADTAPKATLGQPRIFTSDLLQHMGVKSHVISGLLGIPGDFAMDPFTYGGPAAAVALGRGAAGISGLARGAGLKAVREGLQGAATVEPKTAALIKAALEHPAVAEQVAAGADKAETVSKFLFGDRAASIAKAAAKHAVAGAAVQGAIGAGLGAAAGGPEGALEGGLQGAGAGAVFGARHSLFNPHFQPGGIVHALNTAEETPFNTAARDWYAHWGQGTEPGLAIGPTRGPDGALRGPLKMALSAGGDGDIVAGTQIAHLPFTDYGLRVHLPDWYPNAKAGRSAITALQIAKDRSTPASPGFQPVRDRLNEMRVLNGDSLEASQNATLYAAHDAITEAEHKAGFRHGRAGTEPEAAFPGQSEDARDAYLIGHAAGRGSIPLTGKQGDLGFTEPSKIADETAAKQSGAETDPSQMSFVAGTVGDDASGVLGSNVYRSPEVLPLKTEARAVDSLGQGQLVGGGEGGPSDAPPGGAGGNQLPLQPDEPLSPFWAHKEAYGKFLVQHEAEQAARLQRINAITEEIDNAYQASGPASESVAEREAIPVKTARDLLALNDALIESRALRDHAASQMNVAKLAQSIGFTDILIRDPKASMDQIGEKWHRMIEHNPEGVDGLVNAYHALQHAEDRLGRLYQGTIQTFADGPDRGLKELAKHMLGTDDESLPRSLAQKFAESLRHQGPVGKWMADSTYGLSAMDQFILRVFNPRGTISGRYVNHVKNAAKESGLTMERVSGDDRAEVERVMAKHNIPAAQREKVIDIYGALQHAAADPDQKGDWHDLDDPRGPQRDPKTGKIANPGEMLKTMYEAQEDGWFSDKLHPGFMDELRESAAKVVASYREMGTANQADHLLGLLSDNYIPNQLSREARAIRPKAVEAGADASLGAKPGATASYQKMRTSHHVNFQGRDGRWRTFYKFQEDLPTDPEALAEMFHGDKAGLKRATAAVEAIGEYRAMAEANPAMLVRDEENNSIFPYKATDRKHINKMFATDGAFRSLVMNHPGVKNLMETDPTIIHGAYVAAHDRNQAIVRLIEHLLEVGVEIPKIEQNKVKRAGFSEDPTPGAMKNPLGPETTVTTGGVRMEIAPSMKSNYRGGNQVLAIRHGDQLYRRIDSNLMAWLNGNGMMEALGKKADTLYLPPELADLFEDRMSMLHEDKLGPILSAVDKVTQTWKTFALLHPAFMARNAIQRVFFHMAAAGVGSLNDFVDPQLIKFVLAFDRPEALEKMSIKLGDQTISGTKFRELVLDSHVKQRGIALANAGPAYEAEPGALTAMQRVIRTFTAPFFKAEGLAEDHGRIATFASLLRQGHEPMQAAQATANGHLDYHDFSRVEERYFRRIFPFYCVPDHTEILTRAGWKHREQLKVGEQVMTYSVERDELEWGPCLEVSSLEHNQPLNVFSSKRGVRLECTDDHRWATVRPRHKVKGKWYGGDRRMVDTKDFNGDTSIIAAAEFLGDGKSTLTPEQAALYGWLLTDGYWRFKGKSCEAVLYQSPKKFLAEVRRVAGGKPRKPHPQTGVVCVPVLKDRLAPIMHLLRLGKDGCASVPCGLSRCAVTAMYRAMYMAEGTVAPCARAKNYQHFAAERPAILECFRLLCLMLGKRTKTGPHGCYVGARRTMKVAEMTKVREHYTGIVWCPRTANGTWVMRQNGTITITGNSWFRGNLPNQVELLMRRPQYAAAFPKLKHAIEQAFAGEEVVPDNQRPEWMREAMATQMGKDPQNRWAVMADQVLPPGDMLHLLMPMFGIEGALAFVKFFGSGVNPLITAIPELAAGHELFSGQSIGASSTQGDITVGSYLQKKFLRIPSELGWAGTAAGAAGLALGGLPGAIAGSYGGAALSGGGRVGEYAGKGLGQGLARYAGGGLVQSFDDQRLSSSLAREFREKTDRIHAAFARADRAGDEKGKLEAQMAVLGVYEQMQAAGLPIPKWAARALSPAAAGSAP